MTSNTINTSPWGPVQHQEEIAPGIGAEAIAELEAEILADLTDPLAADKRDRRVEAAAAKLAAETYRAEPPVSITPDDDTIRAMLAGCVKPPPAELYDEIRAAYSAGLAEWQPAAETITISLEIDNTYELYDEVHTSVTDQVIPAPPIDHLPRTPDEEELWDIWAWEHINAFTGVGHERGNSWHDVVVTSCSLPWLVGHEFNFGY